MGPAPAACLVITKDMRGCRGKRPAVFEQAGAMGSVREIYRTVLAEVS